MNEMNVCGGECVRVCVNRSVLVKLWSRQMISSCVALARYVVNRQVDVEMSTSHVNVAQQRQELGASRGLSSDDEHVCDVVCEGVDVGVLQEGAVDGQAARDGKEFPPLNRAAYSR